VSVVVAPAKAERIFAALAEGGTVTLPIGETFRTQRFGMVTDAFGTPCMGDCENQWGERESDVLSGCNRNLCKNGLCTHHNTPSIFAKSSPT